ncbi:MAG TPA: energy-coupling factor transporter transmembrane protein EcfT, partial [Thermoanaerobaculia bacterium]|nr:energy-coupling factor transporter transmembrane protein EcfT [Thermoanaerobaculia bacterium]
MSAGPILTRTSLVLAIGALALWLSGVAGLVPPGFAVPGAAVLAGAAALAALAAGSRRAVPPVREPSPWGP